MLLRVPRFVEVIGDSMYPTYEDGEVLFVYPVFSIEKLKEGDVIIFKSPEDKKRVLIKRVDKLYVHSKLIKVLGDNSRVSHDSREFGCIPFSSVLGKLKQQRAKGDE